MFFKVQEKSEFYLKVTVGFNNREFKTLIEVHCSTAMAG